MTAAASSSSSAPPEVISTSVSRILLPRNHPIQCCSCLRPLVPDVDEFFRCETTEQQASWSAFIGLLIPIGAVFCKLNCWSSAHNTTPHPNFVSQPCAPINFLGSPDPYRPLHAPSRFFDDVESTSDVADAAVDLSPPARVREATWEEVVLAYDQLVHVHRDALNNECRHAHKVKRVSDAPAVDPGLDPRLDDIFTRATQLRAITGAPSPQHMIQLVHAMWPRVGGAPDSWEDAVLSWPHHPRGRGNAWKFSRSPLFVAVVGLAHIRLDDPYRALAGYFGLSVDAVAWRMTRKVGRRLALMARDPTFLGCVRYLEDRELDSTFPPRFRKYSCLTHLRAIADCFPVFVQGTPANNRLHNLLYDGQQHPGERWVKVLLIVAPCGYIMDVAGPFAPAGKAVDGRILTAQILDSDDCWQFALRGGTWLVDYGFRGVRAPPNLTIHMPKKWPTKGVVGRQGRRLELDHNNIVCSARWVVEAANERVENWRFFNGRKRPASQIQDIITLCLAVSFLFNRWHRSVMK